MTRLRGGLFAVFVVLLAVTSEARAGMPSVTVADVSREMSKASRTGLTDLARQRIEVISFFLVGLLICTGIIQRVWNSLRKDLPVLPRLSYARALGIIVLWGLLFVLVLTMISGARELMTPGAWEKKGVTYRLTPQTPIESEIAARYESLRKLGEKLVGHAKVHHGEFPKSAIIPEIDESFWQVPTSAGGRYLYVGGRLVDEETPYMPGPLAYEPGSVGPDRLVLMTDGTIRWMPATEIKRALSSGEP